MAEIFWQVTAVSPSPTRTQCSSRAVSECRGRTWAPHSPGRSHHHTNFYEMTRQASPLFHPGRFFDSSRDRGIQLGRSRYTWSRLSSVIRCHGNVSRGREQNPRGHGTWCSGCAPHIDFEDPPPEVPHFSELKTCRS